MIFISFATKMIKDKLHEIGILKALGTDSGTVSFIFGLQIVLVAVTTCILGTIGYSFLVDVSNNLLIVSLRGLTSSQLVLNLRFLVFHPVVVLRNYALILFLTIISMLIPLVKISRIQPVKIINDRE
jgi:ABC-type lipoprotein release transport system permease subunit